MSETNQTAIVSSTATAAEKTKASKRAFAYKLSNFKNLVGGLTAGADVLKAKGFTPEFITAIQRLHQDILDVDNQRHAAKSQSITLTKNLADKVAEMEDKYSEAKKRIKLELPRAEWPKYGFFDQR